MTWRRWVAGGLLLVAIPAVAQVVINGGGGLSPGTTPIADCTAKSIFYADGSKVMQCNSIFTYDAAGGAGVAMLTSRLSASVPAAEAIILGMAGGGGGATATNAGVAGIGTRDTGTYTYGVYGSSRGTATNRFGGFFTLDSVNSAVTQQTGVSALVADNYTTAANIFEARDNQIATAVIQDGGSTWEKIGTKDLVAANATAFVQIAIASGARQAGVVYYSIDASDASDFQERSGVLNFAIVNKAGTETCSLFRPSGSATVDNTTDGVAVSAGTLTNTFTCDTAPTNAVNIAANAASSLTETTLRINYHVRLYGNAVAAVTAQ